MQPLPVSPSGPVILIDESLTDRALATALSAVDYNAIASTVQFGPGTPDPMIIQWLGFQGGIWVTADLESKRKHRDAIKDASIHILWIERPKKVGFSKKAQLLLIISVIEPVLKEISRSKVTCYFVAKFSGERPKLERLP